MARLPSDVKRHVHRDTNVTLTRLRDLRREPLSVRLQVEAELRRRASDDSPNLELTIAGLAVAFIALLVAPTSPAHLQHVSWPSNIIAGIIIGIGAAIIVSPFAIRALAAQERRVRATVWLAAYAEEPGATTHLARRGRVLRRNQHGAR
ncbi:hypothetical protein [Leifsonia virtsii]|uniref:Uncharacterized protein n=1 Tax=Leifsonia virtsii TaxID=3035915 RepID=A0ABT8IY87_9MICO|nr:hypothetical protein [Leifsonia virtsii]MDN4597628.1 hypothetical protein [Leifsonia virtsii]